ncbi:hypothetical protein JXB12_13415 [candidate division KSB1 bacterium]|nr:hypothetical protein [candidate division KSB1 bacterium]
MSRSSGIGLKMSYWNITNHPTRIATSNFGRHASVDISGFGAWIHFSSRAHLNWFFEFQIGAIGGTHMAVEDYVAGTTEVSALVPILLGMRYDMMSSRIPGYIQPYINGGGGPYWISSIKTRGAIELNEQEIVSYNQFGIYAGGGANILLTDWLGLNFNITYHFVDLKFEEEFSGLEFGLGLNFMWGRRSEIFEIKDVQLIVSDIYPAYYQFYNTYPIALVRVKNIAGYPIEVNLRSRLANYSERPSISGYKRIENGKSIDIPVTLIFGSMIQEISTHESAVLDIEVEARVGKSHIKTLSAPITIHNKNAWNGDIDKLNYFITPDEPDILKVSRELSKNLNEYENNPLLHFKQAVYIFDYLNSSGITYHKDPNILFYEDDRVQYALETMQIGSGDCDDLVVLYSSFLESLGIKTAFVEVQDPNKEIAHLYLIFDTDIQPEQGRLISSNEKKYIIREKGNGVKTIWIPLETTLISAGFEEAWKVGAVQYLRDGIIENGIRDGWVKIIHVQ